MVKDTSGGSKAVGRPQAAEALSCRLTDGRWLLVVITISFLFFSLAPTLLHAQEVDVLDSVVIQEDSVPVRQSVGVNQPGDSVLADTVVIDMVAEDHLPRRAALYSAVLPGLGQIYNKKYWKVPILYGGFAILGYLVVFNNDQYQILRRARIAEESGQREQNPLGDLGITQYQNTTSLANNVDNARQNRDQMIIYTAVLYGLNIMDAIVDAHLIEFDVNPDLSFKLEPTAGTRLAYHSSTPSLPYTGFALTLGIK